MQFIKDKTLFGIYSNFIQNGINVEFRKYGQNFQFWVYGTLGGLKKIESWI